MFLDILFGVELLPLVLDVPARAVAFADGVRPPLSLIIQALLSVRVPFFVEITVIAILRPSKRFSKRSAVPLLSLTCDTSSGEITVSRIFSIFSNVTAFCPLGVSMDVSP